MTRFHEAFGGNRLGQAQDTVSFSSTHLFGPQGTQANGAIFTDACMRHLCTHGQGSRMMDRPRLLPERAGGDG